MEKSQNLGENKVDQRKKNIFSQTQDGVKQILDSGLDMRQDYFLQNPPQQPKREIADYVEQQGILVPRRFNSLSEALDFVKSGGEIMIRSEHPDEYNGASGLLESYTLNKDILQKGKEFYIENEKDFSWEKSYNYEKKHRLFWQMEKYSNNQEQFEKSLRELSSDNTEIYTEFLSIDQEEFQNKISYSYREKIAGRNRSIIADSAVLGRYHLYTSKYDPSIDHIWYDYSKIDDGKIIQSYNKDLIMDVEDSLNEVVEFYEKTRMLEKFNEKHCPIIEFQTNENNHYFLQYHRTQDCSQSQFILNRELEEWEFKAEYVRGSTPPEGIQVTTSLYGLGNGYSHPIDEEAYFHLCGERRWNEKIHSEIMSRKRICNFLSSDWELIPDEKHHFAKSKLFYSKIAILLPEEKNKYLRNLYHQRNKTDWLLQIPIRVVSDGRTAYVKFLNTDPQ